MAESPLLYQKVAADIESQIRTKLLGAGDRLPSVRNLSRLHNVSISTVLQAYMHLENRGLIEARPQSGFFVRTASSLEAVQEPQVRCSQKARPIAVTVGDVINSIFTVLRDKDIVSLGAACPSPELFPHKKLNRLTAQILKDFPMHSSTYDMPPGYLPLRKQLAKRALQAGTNIHVDDIITTVGAMEALTLALKVTTKPGDTVLIESPIYYGTLQTLETLGLRAVEVACHPGTGVDPAEVAQILKKEKIKAGIFIPNFNNPMGSLMPDESKKELVKLFSEREIPLIEDDIYGDLHFSQNRPRLLKSFDSKDWVITCSSFSKTLAPGFRVGWMTSSRFQEQLRREKFISTVATPTLPQIVVSQYLEDGGYDRHVRKLREIFSVQIHKVSEAVHDYFPEETKFTRPSGGFVLWVELPKKVDSLELHNLALQKGLAITPGVIFSARGQYKNSLRLNCGNVWSPEVDKSLKKLGQLVEDLAKS